MWLPLGRWRRLPRLPSAVWWAAVSVGLLWLTTAMGQVGVQPNSNRQRNSNNRNHQRRVTDKIPHEQ